jgi:putative ubiquitin-RnfH superfamily antitoxin RatB of RatAB toxin-antitoxin module
MAPPQITIKLLLPPDDEVNTVALASTATVRDALLAAHNVDENIDVKSHYLVTLDEDEELFEENIPLARFGDECYFWVRLRADADGPVAPVREGSDVVLTSPARNDVSTDDLRLDTRLGEASFLGCVDSTVDAEEPPATIDLSIPSTDAPSPIAVPHTDDLDPENATALPLSKRIDQVSPERTDTRSMKPINYGYLVRKLVACTHQNDRLCRQYLNACNYDFDSARDALERSHLDLVADGPVAPVRDDIAPEIEITLILPPHDDLHAVTLTATATVRDALIAAHNIDERIDVDSYYLSTLDDDFLDHPIRLSGLAEPRDFYVCSRPAV